MDCLLIDLIVLNLPKESSSFVPVGSQKSQKAPFESKWRLFCANIFSYSSLQHKIFLYNKTY